MNKKINLTEEIIKQLAVGDKPRVLLHCCCAPCAGYVVDLLRDKCDLTLFYYNPNITDIGEYNLRLAELVKLAEAYGVKVVDGGYNGEFFGDMARGLEDEREGGVRCAACIGERLRVTSSKADELGCDYFMTTLTVSPRKNASAINESGRIYPKYLASDFKKNDGYKKSVEICGRFGFYRQNYCGCEYSKRKFADQ